ncbi:MAG: hypothetical protein ACRCXM_12985, partial [Beijerinckiaceae bacterium]
AKKLNIDRNELERRLTVFVREGKKCEPEFQKPARYFIRCALAAAENAGINLEDTRLLAFLLNDLSRYIK